MEAYAPGFGPAMLGLLEARTAAEHAAFFLPHLASGQRLLDVGCGPGTITLGLAERVAPGQAVGIDREAAQTRAAAAAAGTVCVGGRVRFETAEAADLPFADGSFERVFAHGLFEHVPDAAPVLAEFRRVLVPGGLAGVASSDWGGAVVVPADDPLLTAAIERHLARRRRAGGDPGAGRRLPGLLSAAGFDVLEVGARLENDPERQIAAHLAAGLDEEGGGAPLAGAVRGWASAPGGFFAQCWVSVVGRAP